MNSVYRAFDVKGRLLYVGLSTDVPQRFHQHATSSLWWGQAERVDLTHYATLEEARSAELAAIKAEVPAYNLMGRASFDFTLSEAREHHCLTRVEFADRFGISVHVVRGWETGTRRPTPEQCTDLIQFFGPHITRWARSAA